MLIVFVSQSLNITALESQGLNSSRERLYSLKKCIIMKLESRNDPLILIDSKFASYHLHFLVIELVLEALDFGS